MRVRFAWLSGVLALAWSSAALAGPPYLTDDPEPTDTGHWEIYAPVFDGAGRGKDWDGATGVEVNYGLAPDIQLSLGVPLALTHDSAGWHSGAGDIELSGKYRFYHDKTRGLSVAFFPAVTLPTARLGFGADRATATLPLWLQKDAGAWTLFGGGGYGINPGAGHRDTVSFGLAATRDVTRGLQLGGEIYRQSADTIGGEATTSLGLGAVIHLGGAYRLLFSAGPTFPDHGHDRQIHAFAALGLDL